MKRQDRLTVTQTIPFEGKRKQFLKYLLESNNFDSMIEVGVDTGKSTFFLLDNLSHLKLYAVDTNIKKFYTEEIKEKYKDRLIPIQGVSYSIADQLQDSSVDLVFIDADHSYEAVKKDILKFTPKLKPGGILCGHDIDYPGVNKAVKEMIKDFDIGPNYVWVKRN